MVRNYKRKTSRAENYTQEELRTAVEAVKSGRQTIVQAATQFQIPKPTLVDHVKNRRGAKSTTQGRPTALSPEDENRLASLIKIMEKCGYGLTKKNVLQLVHKYIVENKIQNPFKDNYPGQDWWRGFKNRQKLSIKKPQMVELGRKKAQDPFVIQNYFDVLDRTIKELNLENKPHNIWNLDESSFSHDPTKTKIVGARGIAATRTVSGPGRENTSVLIACSAGGDKCPPLFIFKGKNVWDKWVPAEGEGFPGSTFAATQKWVDGGFCVLQLF